MEATIPSARSPPSAQKPHSVLSRYQGVLPMALQPQVAPALGIILYCAAAIPAAASISVRTWMDPGPTPDESPMRASIPDRQRMLFLTLQNSRVSRKVRISHGSPSQERTLIRRPPFAQGSQTIAAIASVQRRWRVVETGQQRGHAAMPPCSPPRCSRLVPPAPAGPRRRRHRDWLLRSQSEAADGRLDTNRRLERRPFWHRVRPSQVASSAFRPGGYPPLTHSAQPPHRPGNCVGPCLGFNTRPQSAAKTAS